MIKVVLFDLGLTLVDAQKKPFAHVPEALATIQGLHTAAGKPVRSALVSDFELVSAPPTAAKIAPVFTQYLAALKATGLREFFEPVARRVTLSTHVGVMKPARAVFEKALRRLQVKATLAECVFITEEASHVAAARVLGLQALRFASPGAAGAAQADFTDWSQAPALITHLLGATTNANMAAAINAHLAAQGVDVADVQASSKAHAYQVRGSTWHSVAVAGQPGLKNVQVALPLQTQVSQGPHGELHVKLPGPDATALDEAAAFVTSLAEHGQIDGVGVNRTTRGQKTAPRSAATHQIETDAEGRCKLVRKRFTAF